MLRAKSKELLGPALDDPDRTQNRTVEFAANLEFFPTPGALSSFNAKVSACFRQTIDRNGLHTLHPIMSIHTMVPSSSKFDCVKNGDLDGILRLLKKREASLRDCDKRCLT